MIIKVIHSNFELDLSNYPFTNVEENNWLSTKILAKYTYPVEMDLTDEQLKYFLIAFENADSSDALFDVKFMYLGELHDAVLEVERIIGRSIVMQIRHGLEEFPNFDKNLSELPLHVQELAVSIYEHAETIITQTYPDVNYNFPQVITDKFSTEDEQWQYFEGVINNYVDDAFLENEYDAVEDEQVNRNIMQPLPYLLHVLVKAFEAAGYELQGDILIDPDLKKALIYNLSEFYYKFTTESFTAQVNCDEYDSIQGSHGLYSETIEFPEPGRYKIAGNVIVRARSTGYPHIDASVAKFTYNGSTIWSGSRYAVLGAYKEKFYTINETIDFTGTEGDVEFISDQLKYQILQGEIIDDGMIMDVTITQLAKFDGSGNLVSTLINPTEINLSKCVPNMTVGECVQTALNWRQYAVDVTNNVVSINKKKDLIDSITEAVDLTPFEVQFPEKNSNQSKTFKLGFFDFSHDEYSSKSMLIDITGYQMDPTSFPEDTEETIINGLPLPLKQFNGVVTAHGFLDEDSKLLLVLYDGLTSGLNVAQDPEGLSLINTYLNYHETWFNFLLNSFRRVWTFSSYYEQIVGLKVKSLVYAYKRYHIIRRLSRKNSSPGVITTEIEIESLD